jgi:catechol-2,3-dioxygenase
MPVRRLNHAVLYVRDVPTSVEFYTGALDFEVLVLQPRAAFLRASGSTNDHDLGLFGLGAAAQDHEAGSRRVGLYHLAWEVETLADLAELRERLSARKALVGESDHTTTKSLYAKDPDGIEFEVCWIVPRDRLGELGGDGSMGVQALDLDRELERYGASTVGGIGVSWPG